MTRVCVYGLYHLGSVTAACMADYGFETVGLDDESNTVEQLNCGEPPLFEPGLSELISKGIERKKLTFTNDKKAVESQTHPYTFIDQVNINDAIFN